jgi:hypothetical protein
MNMKSSILFLLVVSIGFSSCIKKEVTPLADEGKTFVKILQSSLNELYFSPFSDVRAISLFSVRRDANSADNLQKSSPLVLTRVDAMVTRFNAANGSDFAILPDSLYTLVSTITRAGNIYNSTFNSGDFAREFIINLNGSKWDLSKKYALGFALTSAGTATKSSGMDSIVVTLSIKNQWDGKYNLRCGFYHPVYTPAGPHSFSVPVELHTSGVTKVKLNWDGSYAQPSFDVAGAFNSSYFYFGGQEPEITIDPTTNAATVQNVAAGAVTFYTMGRGFNNQGHRQSFDPADKSIVVHWGYSLGAGGTFVPGTSRAWADSLYYVGPR